MCRIDGDDDDDLDAGDDDGNGVSNDDISGRERLQWSPMMETGRRLLRNCLQHPLTTTTALIIENNNSDNNAR